MSNFIRIPYKSRKEFLELRKPGIGGSDACALYGYKSNIELWQEKALGEKKKDINNEEFIEYGTKAEAPLRRLFSLTYSKQIKVYYKKETLVRNDYSFIRCNLDGELTVKEDCTIDGVQLKKGMKGIYEGKTAFLMSSLIKAKWENSMIPQNYYYQLLHNLLVTDYDFAILNVEMRTLENGELKFKREARCLLKSEVINEIKELEENKQEKPQQEDELCYNEKKKK